MADRPMAPLSARPPLPPSPCCAAALSGGPAVVWCTACGHSIHASQLDHEYGRAA